MKCVGLGLLILVAATAAGKPTIYYTDLQSGPNSGGERNAGAYVTIYGVELGALQGSSFVSIGGGRAGSYPVWTDGKITVQLGPAAATGDVTVTTLAGVSNPLPFRVRSGNIYYVATNGSDSNSGSFSSPWETLTHARDSIAAGDIVYVRNGVTQTSDDGLGWNACLTILDTRNGTVGNELAMVVYPGEAAAIGSASPGVCGSGIRAPGSSNWVIAGFTLRGEHEALAAGYSRNWRVVGNDMSCPYGNAQSACFNFGPITTMRAYGNNIHDVGTSLSADKVTALYHGVYIVDGVSDLDFGWNRVANVQGCRGIQQNTSTKTDASNLQIHDNVIHDTQCDGIVMTSVDPTVPGGINIYNNVIYNAGKGPANAENSGAWRCIGIAGYNNAGATTGTIEVYSNTMYACGTWRNPPYAGSSAGISMTGPNPGKKIRMRNNIIYLTTGPGGVAPPYVIADDGSVMCTNCDRINGTNNLFFGSGSSPDNRFITNSVNADPLFVNAAEYDLHLRAGSPARQADGSLGAYRTEGGKAATIRCPAPVIVTPGGLACDLSIGTPALVGGQLVGLASDDPSLTLPSNVLIPEGATHIGVNIAAATVAARVRVNLSAQTGGGTTSIGVWLVPAGDTAPLALSVLNAASSNSDGVSPGGMVTVMGMNLAQGTAVRQRFTSAGVLDTELSQVRCLIDNTAAPLVYVSSTQVTAMVPYEVGDTTAGVVIEVAGQRSNALDVVSRLATPGIFTADYSGKGQAAALNGDGTANSSSQPGAKGSVITFYATGLGKTNPAGVNGQLITNIFASPVKSFVVRMGGLDAQVLGIAAMRGSIQGVFEIRARIPDGAVTGDSIPVLITTDGASSQDGVTIGIK